MPIRQSVDQGMTPECRRAMYVFQFLYDQISWGGVDGKAPGGGGTSQLGGGCTIGSCYDNEVEFVCGFAELTPALSSKTDTAVARLRKFVKQLVDDGWLQKNRIYNDQQYIGEMRSGWYPHYSLFEDHALKIRLGALTAEDMARTYTGC